MLARGLWCHRDKTTRQTLKFPQRSNQRLPRSASSGLLVALPTIRARPDLQFGYLPLFRGSNGWQLRVEVPTFWSFEIDRRLGVNHLFRNLRSEHRSLPRHLILRALIGSDSPTPTVPELAADQLQDAPQASIEKDQVLVWRIPKPVTAQLQDCPRA